MNHLIKHIIAIDGMLGGLTNSFQQTFSSRFAISIEKHFQGSIYEATGQILAECSIFLVPFSLFDERTWKAIP